MSTQPPKYAAPEGLAGFDRTWPDRQLTEAPIFCSVDLRDGNQALPNPLSPEAKLEYFQMLCRIGFKHIEVAFPSASQDDWDFTRRLIEENHIPEDVFIMGLTQCREHLIQRTLESFRGAKQAIVHAYIASSDLHMRQVFNMSREDTLKTAVAATTQIRELAAAMPETDIRFEFSPEEFTDTDLDFAMELCTAVYDTWGQATPEKPLIFNLPATVERRPPNHYADMIEWFCRKFPHRDSILVSLHAHNDQGMAVAASQMALLAGADRVEGTLFGHGERTGNVDLVTLACNLKANGVETGLDFSGLEGVAETVTRLTGMGVYYRQPYAGELVFSAFSGSHQDAIRKGMKRRDEAADAFGVGWKVPYLHIDPADVGREYTDLIRINSQSGKGGVAWVLEQDFGIESPKAMHPQLGKAIQAVSDGLGRELTAAEVYETFIQEFVYPDGPLSLVGYWPRPDDENPTWIHGQTRLMFRGEVREITADGDGPVDAMANGLRNLIGKFHIRDYHSQSIGAGSDARAMAFISLEFDDGDVIFGAGTNTNIDQAAVRAIIAGLNRKLLAGGADSPLAQQIKMAQNKDSTTTQAGSTMMAEGNLMISESQGITVAQIQMTAIQDERAINSLAKALFALIDERDVKKLIVDFRAVNFLSSQMIGTLMTLHKKAKAIDGMVVLAGMKPSLMKIFKIMKLNKVLIFADDESDAVTKFPAF